MSLPRLWVALEAPHLEPLEPLLDLLEGQVGDLLLGPALQLGAGPGLTPALGASGFRCWLDLPLTPGPLTVAAMVRLLARSMAAGAVVSLDAFRPEELATMARALAPRPLLVRVCPGGHAEGLTAALVAAQVAALVATTGDRRSVGGGTAGGVLGWVVEGEVNAPATWAGDAGSAAPAAYIDHHLQRHDTPARYLAALLAATATAEA